MSKFRYFLPVTGDYTGAVPARGHEASPSVELIGPRRVIPAMGSHVSQSPSDELITSYMFLQQPEASRFF